MPGLGSLLGLLTLTRPTINGPVFREFLSGVVAVVGLTVVTGMMGGTLLVCGMYMVLQAFIHNGMNADAALITTALITLVIFGVLVAITRNQLARLLDMPKSLVQHEYPVPDQISTLAKSFMDGLAARRGQARDDADTRH